MAPTLNLASLRRAKGITLDGVKNSTLIQQRFLEAIEAEDFSKLPGGVYSTSYLRQYARATGCDESALLRLYKDQIEPQPAPQPVPRQSRFSHWREYAPFRRLFENRQHA